jgi:hypothetical protein
MSCWSALTYRRDAGRHIELDDVVDRINRVAIRSPGSDGGLARSAPSASAISPRTFVGVHRQKLVTRAERRKRSGRSGLIDVQGLRVGDIRSGGNTTKRSVA